MSQLHDQITKLLDDLSVGQAFRSIHDGEMLPLLTDYFVRRIPDEWNAGPPPEIVDGRTLIPLFVGCDSYAIYCADVESHEVFEIDPESPWPPSKRYDNWDAFVCGLFDLMTDDKSDEYRKELSVVLESEST